MKNILDNRYASEKRIYVFELSVSQYELLFWCVFVYVKLYLWSKSISQMHLGLEIRIEIALISILRILGFKILKSLSTPLRGVCPFLYIALELSAKRWSLLCFIHPSSLQSLLFLWLTEVHEFKVVQFLIHLL